MYDLTSLIIISVCLLAAGLAGGYLIGRFTGTGGRALELESELQNSQDNLDQYKEKVYQEFGETAKKFEKLQETYSELHTQLAQSAETLCGSQLVGPMLAAPAVAAVTEREAEQLENLAEEQTLAETEQSSKETNPDHESAESQQDTTEATQREDDLVVEVSERDQLSETDEVLQDSEAAAMTSPVEAAQIDTAELVDESLEATDVDELLEQQTSSNVTKGNFGGKDAA